MTTDTVCQEQRTLRRLLWVSGFLGWGLGTGLLLAGFLAPVAIALSRPALLVVPFVLCPPGGLLWAWLFWHAYAKNALRRRAAGAPS